MNKKTKMLIGVGVVAIAGYVYWKSTQKKSFANLVAPDCLDNPDSTGCKCPCKKKVGTATDGTTLCKNGHVCCNDKQGPCPPKGSQAGS